MAYADGLTVAIFTITTIGILLSIYVTKKIYSKEGFR